MEGLVVGQAGGSRREKTMPELSDDYPTETDASRNGEAPTRADDESRVVP